MLCGHFTPSRYSHLTGSYAFRNNAAILPGDAPLIIRPGTTTIAEMFQRAGYQTAVIGKWHLGLGDGTINWNGKISPGPNEIGFNYSFIVPATLDRVPCVIRSKESHPVKNTYGHLSKLEKNKRINSRITSTQTSLQKKLL